MPVALPDIAVVQKGKTLSVDAAHGVLANDFDPDIHDRLVVSHVTAFASQDTSASVTPGQPGKLNGLYGILSINADGSYSYATNPKAPAFEFRLLWPPLARCRRPFRYRAGAGRKTEALPGGLKLSWRWARSRAPDGGNRHSRYRQTRWSGLAGATAVQVGTATFVQPDAAIAVIRGIEEYLESHDISHVHDLVGSLAT